LCVHVALKFASICVASIFASTRRKSTRIDANIDTMPGVILQNSFA
jgi:hypothetical protein